VKNNSLQVGPPFFNPYAMQIPEYTTIITNSTKFRKRLTQAIDSILYAAFSANRLQTKYITIDCRKSFEIIMSE
jgi:hypothetical protein